MDGKACFCCGHEASRCMRDSKFEVLHEFLQDLHYFVRLESTSVQESVGGRSVFASRTSGEESTSSFEFPRSNASASGSVAPSVGDLEMWGRAASVTSSARRIEALMGNEARVRTGELPDVDSHAPALGSDRKSQREQEDPNVETSRTQSTTLSVDSPDVLHLYEGYLRDIRVCKYCIRKLPKATAPYLEDQRVVSRLTAVMAPRYSSSLVPDHQSLLSRAFVACSRWL